MLPLPLCLCFCSLLLVPALYTSEVEAEDWELTVTQPGQFAPWLRQLTASYRAATAQRPGFAFLDRLAPFFWTGDLASCGSGRCGAIGNSAIGPFTSLADRQRIDAVMAAVGALVPLEPLSIGMQDFAVGGWQLHRDGSTLNLQSGTGPLVPPVWSRSHAAARLRGRAGCAYCSP